MDRREDHMKMSFEYFQIQKQVTQTVRAEKKVHKIKWGHLSGFYVPFLNYGS